MPRRLPAEGTLPRGCRLTLPALLLAALAACASPLPVPVGPPVAPLGEPEIAHIAALVRLEDRREFADAELQAAATALHPAVRRRAALALGRLQHAEGVPLLSSLVQDADTGVAATAAFALGQLGSAAAATLLLPLLDQPAATTRPSVAAEAAAALGKLGGEDALQALSVFLSQADPSPPEAVVEHALLAIWRFPEIADLAPILRWTAAADPELRWRAVYALTRRADHRATANLLSLASDPAPTVRAQAVRGLSAALVDSAGIDRGAALATLLRGADETDDQTAINALRVLGTYVEPDAVRRLESELTRAPWRAFTAAESLGRIGAPARSAAPALARQAADTSRPIGVRGAALLALATVDPPAAREAALRFATSPEWRARAAAARVYGGLGAGQLAGWETSLRDRDARVAAIALESAVAAYGDTLAPLRHHLLESVGAEDVRVRAVALGALARLRDPALLPLFLDAYARAERDTTRDAALAALDALGDLAGAGVPAARAFFFRFPRPTDPLLRRRADERFGEAARAAWGAPLPLEPGRGPEEYEALVREWIAPAVREHAAAYAEIITESGTIELELFAADAPLTVASFLDLAARGYFDGQEWPRVVPNFVIQGGDPRGDQTGGPGYALPDELNRHRYLRGTLGMALSGPDTGGSQFFITHSPQPHLDGGYTVFGRVVAGMDVVDRVVVGERITTIRRVR